MALPDVRSANDPPNEEARPEDFAPRSRRSRYCRPWAPVSVEPEVSVREDVGVDGSNRVTLIWPDNSIQNGWLQVTLLPTENTGLIEPDVFYFGNAIGSSANTDKASLAQVDGPMAAQAGQPAVDSQLPSSALSKLLRRLAHSPPPH